MINRSILFRLWLVLSVIWILFFAFRALSAWQAWEDAERSSERAKVEAFAQGLFEDKGIASYAGAAEATAEERDRAFDNDEDAEREFALAMLFLFAGPAALGVAFRIGRWVVVGASPTR